MKPELSPQHQTDYEHAFALAHQVNAAFDRRHVAATSLAGLSIKDVDKRKATEQQFNQADQDFATYNRVAEVLMPPRVAFEASQKQPEFASETVWQAMSPEQRREATEVRTAMATSRLKELSVTAESLRVVATEVDGVKEFTVTDTGGRDIGNPKKEYDKDRSYYSVISSQNDGLFQFKVGDKIYDARAGATNQVYDARVADARERGVTLPDSLQLAEETNDIHTWTMQTGEDLTLDRVRIRQVREGEVYSGVANPDDGIRDLLVCPAVKLAS